MKMTLMGTGTSHGIPVVGCSCRVCSSQNEKDKRFRCSAYVENTGNTDCDENGEPFATTNVIIDTGPEFRIQCLKYQVKRVDGVLLTHSHADHCHGLDDLRIFSFKRAEPSIGETVESIMKKNPGMSENDAIAMAASRSTFRETKGEGLPIYAGSSTIESIIFRFAYIFSSMAIGGGIPKLNLKVCEGYSPESPLKIGSIEVVPIPMMHGSVVDYGWVLRCRNQNQKTHAIAYLTDCSFISDDAINLVKRSADVIDHVVIDALRVKPHPTHCSFDQALSYADRIGARHTWFTHICHDNTHEEIQKYIDKKIEAYPLLKSIVNAGGSVSPSYDGLVLETE